MSQDPQGSGGTPQPVPLPATRLDLPASDRRHELVELLRSFGNHGPVEIHSTIIADRTRCGRPKHDGSPCRSKPATGGPACIHHLTETERVGPVTSRELIAALLADAPPQPAEPACWSWAVTEQDRSASDEADMYVWQDRRCAGCGHRTDLVLDHDHATALVRGWLCRPCNGQEPGAEGNQRLALYRQKNPASILGIRVRYYSSFSGWAEPAPPPTPLEESPAYLIAGLFAHDD